MRKEKKQFTFKIMVYRPEGGRITPQNKTPWTFLWVEADTKSEALAKAWCIVDQSQFDVKCVGYFSNT